MSSDYGVVTRLARLLALLDEEPVDRDSILESLDYRNSDLDVVRRAFRRDIQALIQMGFDVRRYGGKPPRFSVHGHTRWPSVDGKTCPRCHRLLPLSMFSVAVERPGGRSVYCFDCARESRKQSYIRYRERNLEYARRRREEDPGIAIRKRETARRRREEGRALLKGDKQDAKLPRE